VNLLLDTQVLLWAAANSKRLSPRARTLLNAALATLYFSAVSVWEVAIKDSLGRADFRADPQLLRRGLLDNGYTELPMTSQHAAAVRDLPDIHRDPFDRLLLAQAICEGFTFVTADATLATYPGPIRKV
jgi:PIN domain nuclease of toxin-antitoxin system